MGNTLSNFACKAGVAGVSLLAGAGNALGMAPAGNDPAGDMAGAVKVATDNPGVRASAGIVAQKVGKTLLTAAGAEKLSAIVAGGVIPGIGEIATAVTVYSATKEAVNYYGEHAGECNP